MIRIPALDLILEMDTLNHILQEWIPKSKALRSLAIELCPGVIRLNIDGRLPMLGDRSMTADLSVELRGDEVWLKLERMSVPLPKAAVVGLIASQARQEALRAEGSSLVFDLSVLFRRYEIATQIQSITAEAGQLHLICLME
jgi:hypothetical protein